MYIQRVYHPVAGLLAVEGQVQIGSGKHECLDLIIQRYGPRVPRQLHSD